MTRTPSDDEVSVARVAAEGPVEGEPSASKPSSAPFWEMTPLEEMNREQWESLCDRCGQCCLVKLEDDETGEVQTTSVACKLLDLGTCQCSDYENRAEIVYECEVLTPQSAGDYKWLPLSCAYRRLAEGRGLPWWHPLVSGDPQTVVEAGAAVAGRVISEEHVDMLALIELVSEGEMLFSGGE